MNTKLVVVMGMLIVIGASVVVYNSLNASLLPDVSTVPELLPTTLPAAQTLLETLSLLPDRLAGEPARTGEVNIELLNYTVLRHIGHHGGRGPAYNASILAHHQSAAYNGIQLHIFLTFGTGIDLEGRPYNFTAYDGEELLHLLFNHSDWYQAAVSRQYGSHDFHSWYTATTADRYVYVWDAHSWVIGIEANDRDTLYQATDEWLQHLQTAS